MLKKSLNPKAKQEKEWPVLVYMWAFALTIIGYLIGETVFRTAQPHPFHWLLVLVGGIFVHWRTLAVVSLARRLILA